MVMCGVTARSMTWRILLPQPFEAHSDTWWPQKVAAREQLYICGGRG